MQRATKIDRSDRLSIFSTESATSGLSRIEDLDHLADAFRFELLRSRIGREDTKPAQQHRPGILDRVLHACWKDQDIAGAVSLCADLGSTFALCAKSVSCSIDLDVSCLDGRPPFVDLGSLICTQRFRPLQSGGRNSSPRSASHLRTVESERASRAATESLKHRNQSL
jgi:hypothetical protein